MRNSSEVYNVKVGIIGGGSVGLLFASFLAEQGLSVTIVTRREEQAEKLNSKGLIRQNIDGIQQKSQVAATTNHGCLSQQSLVIVAVKYGHLEEVYNELAKLSYVPPLLFLQNGLGHYEKVIALAYNTVAFGSVTFGAEKKQDNKVLHRGIGIVNIGLARGEKHAFNQLAKLENLLFPLQLVEDPEQMLFQKAFFNCLINPLTAILQVKNGMLLTLPHAHMLLKNLYDEMKLVFPEAASISFEQVEVLCEKTGMNTSSMLSDLLQGRKTEVETIVGAMLNRAKKYGEDLPTLRTLYHLVLTIEGAVIDESSIT